MKFIKPVSLILFCLLLIFPNLSYAQKENSLLELIGKLNNSSYKLTTLEKTMFDLNINRAFSAAGNTYLSFSPIKWDPILKKFCTNFFVPETSFLLKLTTQKQFEQFEAEINGLKFALLDALGIPFQQLGKILMDEIGNLLLINIGTNEGNQLYKIGTFKDGKLNFFKEKL